MTRAWLLEDQLEDHRAALSQSGTNWSGLGEVHEVYNAKQTSWALRTCDLIQTSPNELIMYACKQYTQTLQ